MPLEKYLADGLQSGCTADLTSVQYILHSCSLFYSETERLSTLSQDLLLFTISSLILVISTGIVFKETI